MYHFRGYIPWPILFSVLCTCVGTDEYVSDAAEPPIAHENEPVAGAGDDPVIAEPEIVFPEAAFPAEPEIIDRFEGMSAYTRWLIQKDERAPSTAVLLARMGVSEAGFHGALRDIPAILQVARNRVGKGEPLSEMLEKLSPHVAQIKDFTVSRQEWTSTLPATGDEPGSGWVECTGSMVDARGRKRGTPLGCTGVWELVRDQWTNIRKFAAKALRHDDAPVPGVPLTWGGKMDVARFLARNPHMCLLTEPGAFHNYYFGRRDEPRNTCLEVPEELTKDSWRLHKVIEARRVSVKVSDIVDAIR